MEHYARVTDADYEKAQQRVVQKAVQHTAARARMEQKVIHHKVP